ncbi:MAG: hypothetical protein OEV64_02425 [Desulfobulbaceae bacterium]|nr:hypothetical protein [Desulfobulbaceae bacterium]
MSLSLNRFDIKACEKYLYIVLDEDEISANFCENNGVTIWDKSWSLSKDDLGCCDFSLPIYELNSYVAETSPIIKLIIPDSRVAYFELQMEEIPRKAQELSELVCWRLDGEFGISVDKYLLQIYSEYSRSFTVSVMMVEKLFVENAMNALIKNNLLVDSIWPKTVFDISNFDEKLCSAFILSEGSNYLTYCITDENGKLIELHTSVLSSQDDIDASYMRASRAYSSLCIRKKGNYVVKPIILKSEKDSNRLLKYFDSLNYIVVG